MQQSTKFKKSGRTVLTTLRDSRGANLVEYIILVGVVALIALTGFKYFGKTVDNKITEQGQKIPQIGE